MKNTGWILLVEDDVSLAELTRLALEADDADRAIIVTHDGLSALDCLLRRGEFRTRAAALPEFVLLDLKMPKMDGLEVLRHIRSNPQTKNLPVVIFSSSREPADIARSYQMGANAYVVKSGDFQEFNGALKAIWQFWAVVNETYYSDAAAGGGKARIPSQIGVPA